MQIVLTATGPNNWGLADPIVHYVTSVGAVIAEIQMFNHDEEASFAMLVRLKWPGKTSTLAQLRETMAQIGRDHNLSIRTWSRDEHEHRPRLALCMTYRPEPATAILRAIRDGALNATPVVLLGNRPNGQAVADEFGIPWHMIGDGNGNPDNDRFVELIDRYQADYIVLARYMRLVPPSTCWKFAGGRIINLHHGLLPAFPGAHPYQDAFSRRMLTYGTTVHFIVPELDAGNQIIHQDTFTVAPGTPLKQIIHTGEREHEPRCLVEGLRRVLAGEVELQYHRVVATKPSLRSGRNGAQSNGRYGS